MGSYRVRVRTGTRGSAGTCDVIAVTLVGTRGTSPRTPLDRWGPDFTCGAVTDYPVPSPHPLGRLLLLRLHKGPRGPFPATSWFLESVTVWRQGAGPGGDVTDDVTVDLTDDVAEEGEEEDDDVTDEEGDVTDDDTEEEEEEEEEGDPAPPEGVAPGEVAESDDDDDVSDDVADDVRGAWGGGRGGTPEEEEWGEWGGEEGDTGGAWDPDAPYDVAGDLDDVIGDVIGDVTAEGDDDVTARGPFHFPCYRWLKGFGTWDLPEGTAATPAQERHPLLRRHRQRHLEKQRRRFRLAPFAPGLPWALPLGTPLDPDLQYSLPKSAAFYFRGITMKLHSKLQGFLDRPTSWPSLQAMAEAFAPFHTPVTEYVVQHWGDDAFFGEQYLSGVNPVLLRRCSRLPPNFPVTPQMVAPSLGPRTCLQRELEAGRVFLADYGVLEGIPSTPLNGDPTFLASPLVLLHQEPGGQLLPIAIQLSQQPGPRAPIFLPGDPPWLWLLAKTWVRSCEFLVHEALTHLLRSHLLGEVYALATLRHLPPRHPLCKLLLPHTRFTVHIATLARRFLLNPGGVFDQSVALGRRGLLRLVARGLRLLSYETLVLPWDLRRRRVTRVPRYRFARDAAAVWAAIRSFVKGLVCLYYPDDGAVRGDPELQAWVGEIFTCGFLGRRRSGVPSSLSSVPQLVTFLTMIIYSCSAHHAATNSGQFELGAFPPNLPSAMRGPPPSSKAPLGEGQFLASLPAVNTTATTLGVLWVLRNEPLDMRPLGCYPEHHFTEGPPRRLIRRFRRRLAAISRRIRRRNQGQALPYTYLDPANIENSVAI